MCRGQARARYPVLERAFESVTITIEVFRAGFHALCEVKHFDHIDGIMQNDETMLIPIVQIP